MIIPVQEVVSPVPEPNTSSGIMLLVLKLNKFPSLLSENVQSES